MKVRLREDFSPCIAKDRTTGVGVPLVPGGLLDFAEIGIDGPSFMRQFPWAFEDEAPAKVAKNATPKRAAKKKAAVEQATDAPGEERD